MSLEDLEELARMKGLRGRAYQDLQRVLDDVAGEERSYFMWHRLYIFTAAISLWVIMFACIIFLLGLDYDLSMPNGLGTFLAAVLAVTFWLFLVSMFKSAEHAKELSSLEARAYAIIESRAA